MSLLSRIPIYEVIAIADPAPQSQVDAGVVCYTRNERDYLRMLEECRPDLVFVASPWQHHVEHAHACMRIGADVALEIKGGFTLDEYAPLTLMEQEGAARVFPMENTLFMREVMSMQGLIESGLLGQVVYMRGGYRHDLRRLLLDDDGRIGRRAYTESIWRGRFYCEDNADLYPTHGFAPLCHFGGLRSRADIHRVSAHASMAVGMRHRIEELGGDTSLSIKQGDVVVTQIESRSGMLVTLTHDTTLPRPRSLDFEVQGTRGIWDGVGRRIYIEHTSPYETWEDDAAYITRYEHPLWQRWGDEALRHDSHHRGMDYVMLRALAAHLSGEEAYPATLDDLILWTSVTPWSRRAIADAGSILL